MKQTNLFLRVLAFVLCAAMMLPMTACAPAKTGETAPQQNGTEVTAATDPDTLSREEKEQVIDLMGDSALTREELQQLSDTEVDKLVQDLVNGLDDEEIINLGSENPLPEVEVKDEYYDEEGGMSIPFDLAYPELVEGGHVPFSNESLLVKLRSGELTNGLKAAGVVALEESVVLDDCAWYTAKLLEGTDAYEALAQVRKLKEVLLAELNYVVTTALAEGESTDTNGTETDGNGNGNGNGNKVKEQWHLKQCGIQNASKLQKYGGGASGVIVAVIDTGVDYDHEDLAQNIWRNTAEIPDNGIDDDKNGYVDDYYGVDIVAGKGSGDDTNGHGTHVAGIIAAQNNKLGVIGIAYNVQIMPVKAASHTGLFLHGDIAKAVQYAYDHGADVINMSFGGTSCSIAVQDALAKAYTRCVLVASAGNSGAPNEKTDYYDPMPNYPGALTYVLGVMSVNQSGVESGFTNWDVKAFNGVEYELYAPGEAIVSTLPNNTYGALSGTSMAAPMVSAMAAILRSEFEDRDMYPTKFIYGQLSSTSGDAATCCNPQKHTVNGMLHNLPQIVNLYDALTKMPKPEVGVQEYYVFDLPKYSSKNNGDGVIDAGETIALGFVLRNRWGMSENTKVTIDTKSEDSGMEDPYITIHNPTVNYGSVGTYSTQDCGKIYTDELFTDWEEPFLITIAEDCPNDYIFTVNITVACENALDEKDDTVYKSWGGMKEYVRNGYILPSEISEDMVLTKDNLYIIPSATIINEGVTVRVEPGTHIQFWSNDADDPYADSYIAYLLVNGNFLVEGTKEEPVYIYPSKLMNAYGVEIGSSTKGYVSLKYADVTNFFYSTDHTGTGNRIDQADHCTFRNNYSGSFKYRSLSGGVVYSSSNTYGNIGNINAKDCVFYKLAFSGYTYLKGTYDRCIFAQCGIDFLQNGQYCDCVFLGNSMVDQTNPEKHYNSSIEIKSASLPEYDVRAYYRKETGTTYLWVSLGMAGWDESLVKKELNELCAEQLAKDFGASYLVPRDEEELQWLKDAIIPRAYTPVYKCEDGFLWADGTPVPDTIPVKTTNGNPENFAFDIDSKKILQNDDDSLFVFAIPGYVLPEDITFAEYAVDMDTGITYQIAPQNTPIQLPADQFLYESSDEAIITVSATGLVTPVGIGTADVWVYSLDKAVRNRITFTVRDYVPLEALTLQAPAEELAVGESMTLSCLLMPENTTRKNVVYTSSDDSIAKVVGGIVTGVSSGKVTITATCEGFTDTVELQVYRKATSLQLGNVALSAALEDGARELPEVITSSGAETILSWRTTDPAVAVAEGGKLTLKGLGTTSLIVTDRRSGLSAACLVVVSQEAANPVREIAFGGSFDNRWVLLENGQVYVWNSAGISTPTLVTEGVKDIAADDESALLLKEDGTIESWWGSSYCSLVKTYNDFVGWDIVDVELRSSSNIWVCTADGNAYAMGSSNSYGQLGIGSTVTVTEPTLINLDGVIDIENYDYGTWLLTDKGELYATGNLYYTTTAEPVRIDTNVSRILQVYNACTCYYLGFDGKVHRFYGVNSEGNRHSTYSTNVADLEQVAYSDSKIIGIRDGKVYTANLGGELTQVVGISNAVAAFTKNKAFYVSTADGLLLAFGENSISYNSMAGVTTENPVTAPVIIPLTPIAEETLTLLESNLAEGVLGEDELLLTFNKQLGVAKPKLYADGKQVTVQTAIADYNHLTVTRGSGFAQGVTYELVFAPGELRAAGGIANAEELRIAFAYQPGDQTAPDAGADATQPDAGVDATQPEVEKVVYESILDETVERILTAESIVEKLNAYIDETQYNPQFTGNAILNPISTDFEVSHWLRPQAPTITAGTTLEIPLGGNYWGSTNETAIGLQMIDYTDFITYGKLNYAPYLTSAPENTFPFVTSVTLLNKDGQAVTKVGNEKVTFRVTFNRDMDTSIPLEVRFGSAYPYGDYEVPGKYVDARTWEGEYTLNTLIENGYQYFSIDNGCSATDDLVLQWDLMRFGFEIDTTAAQALIMQGVAEDTGIQLTWTQDDFDTLMGYNVYRSTSKDGLYTLVNKVTIPADTKEFFDANVEPGVVYYYNFTVVKTDLTESEPSGKIVIMSKDTMAPNVYHSGVATATEGRNLVITATISDNLNIAYANVYYRVTGQTEWKTVRLNSLNTKCTAVIPFSDVTTAGLEYYIEACDGVSSTFKGSAEDPFTVVVQQNVSAGDMGDINADGKITNLDALILLQGIHDKYNLSAEEFLRADLDGNGKLEAWEALRILQYVSGTVGYVDMRQ